MIIIIIIIVIILWDLEIQTDYLIPARRPDLVLINKKKRTCWIVDFAVPTILSEIQRKWKERQVPGHCQRTKNPMEYEDESDTNCSWSTWNSSQRFEKVTGRVEIERHAETIQTTALLTLVRILKRIMKIWGDLVSFRFQWKTIS